MENKFIRLTSIYNDEFYYLNVDKIQKIYHHEFDETKIGSAIWIDNHDRSEYAKESPNRIIDLINGKIDISILEEGDEITCWEPGGMWSKTFEVVQNPHDYGLCWKSDIGGDTQYSDDLDERDMDLKYWHRK